MTAIGLALIAILVFSGSSVFFAEYSRRHSALWMNTFKALVAVVAFTITVVAMTTWGHQSWQGISGYTIFALLSSGVLGLAIGDIFLLMSYARIGSARALMIFSFQPIFIGIQAYLFFGQTISWLQGLAILFMMACLFVISHERFQEQGHWEIRGILYALIGVLMDNTGVILTRSAFNNSPIDSFQANWIRTLGAAAALLVISALRRRSLWQPFRTATRKDQSRVLVAAFLGTFVSLICYLTAIQTGHLATISALGGMIPLAAGFWEWLIEGKRPTRAFVFGFIFSMAGLALLLVGQGNS